MPVLRPLLAVLLLATTQCAVGAGAVYRCSDGGRTVYTDRSCDGGTALIERSTPEALQVSLNESDAPAVAQEAQPLSPVIPGMTPAMVYGLLGRPSAMQMGIEGITPTERWRYRTPHGTLLVVFQHGRVTSVR